MSIHVARNNMLFGNGAPSKISPAYYGQIYIDVAANPRQVYISTSEDPTGWLPLGGLNHKHNLTDVVGLREEVSKLVQQEGIESSIASLKDGTNIWTGNNFFDGTLRNGSKDVLTTGSSIGLLADVDITKLDLNSVLAWDGSKFIPMKLTGVSNDVEGGIDFSAYLRKNQIVNSLGSSATDAPLGAAQGKVIMDTLKKDYSPIKHSHTEYSLSKHTHSNYFDLEKDSVSYKGNLVLGGDFNHEPLSLVNENGRVTFGLPRESKGSAFIGFAENGGSSIENVVIGGSDGSIGKQLSLNFSEIIIPTGRVRLGESKKSLSMPPIKIGEKDNLYVGGTTRVFGLDLNDSGISGVGQMVFGRPSMGRANSILFPKSHAGNSKPTDVGLYHYLRLVKGEMQTDTALVSEAKYIQLDNKKIFFTSTEPGKEAKTGDLWFKV